RVSLKFACPHCGQRLAAESEWAGQQIACPTCAQSLAIPAPVAALSSSPSEREAKSQIAIRKSQIPQAALILPLAIVVLASLLGAGAWLVRWVQKSKSAQGGGLPAWHGFASKREGLTDVKIFPSVVNLQTKQDRQSLVVQAIYADGI